MHFEEINEQLVNKTEFRLTILIRVGKQQKLELW